MELPLDLREAIEKAVSGEKPERLKKVSQEITRKYKNESGQGRSLVSEKLDASVYAAVRMPATFGAVDDALRYTLAYYHGSVRSVFDVGAGSGAATWAVDEVLDPDTIVCFEREKAMRQVGISLMASRPSLLGKTEWLEMDLVKDGFADAFRRAESVGAEGAEEASKQADLVISSYVLNELSGKDRILALEKLWAATSGALLIVEPGTKEGFAVISQIRSYMLENVEKTGAYLIAPCPHDGPCGLDPEDWCHFTCRVQRSRLHKQLKEADVPYEDEKYAYIAFSRTPCEERAQARVLRHPYITKGQIDLRLCVADAIQDKTVRKRDGELFKQAKKCKQGDSLAL